MFMFHSTFDISRYGRKMALVLGASLLWVSVSGAQGLTNLLFLHHSVGSGLIGGGMRETLAAYNSAHGTQLVLWDHGYNDDGLRNPAGVSTGTGYNVPGDNTEPSGYDMLWTSSDADAIACRTLILNNHQAIAFKSCFSASAIADAAMLDDYKTHYLSIRNFMDQHPEKLFMLLSPPPRHRGETTAEQAGYTRQFAQWLKSADFMGGHNNVVCFDLFDALAGFDNMLKSEYEPEGIDSHPNAAANQIVGPQFMNIFAQAAANYQPGSNPNPTATPIPASTPTPTPVPILPTASILVNGQGGTVNLSPASMVTISASLNSGTFTGYPVDWWLVAEIPSGWYSFIASSWSWVPGLSVCHQGPLGDIAPTTLLQIQGLSEGTYRLYFGIDGRMNGTPDYDLIVYDRVTLNVTAGPTPTPSPTPIPLPSGTNLVQASDFTYLGAFRLPGGDTRPQTFAYGGGAMTYCPTGDPADAGDGFPGSLFIAGHDRMPYGDLPNGNQVAEVSIPVPIITSSLSALNTASVLQNFSEMAPGLFDTLEEIPRMGLQYLNAAPTGPKLHLTFGQHFQDEGTASFVPSHAWLDLTLSAPNTRGSWYIGQQSLYSVNGYLMEIPSSWADQYVGGRVLATGRYRDGGWSGQGPSLFAYKPWQDTVGTPPVPGTRLSETVLLLYTNSYATADVVSRSLSNYQHADEWNGGAWLTTSSGKTAVLFSGTKGTGTKYWYGYANPEGVDVPCVDTEHVGEFTVCYQDDGASCPNSDLTGCASHNEYRGWWASRFTSQFILYDPAQFANVAAGTLNPWDPQPYTHLDIDDRLFMNPAGVEPGLLGTGVQRRYRLGSITYDRTHDLLFVLEQFADDTKPVVHVWRVR